MKLILFWIMTGDFDQDISNFSITALGTATESGNEIQSDNMKISAIQEPNGPGFISEYLQSDNGRVAIEIYNKGIADEAGYTLEIYQYNKIQNKKLVNSMPLYPMQPNMPYIIIDNIFYDFFDITNAPYYNEEATLSGNGIVNVAFVLKKNGVVVDAIGDPNGTAPILSQNGTMVRKKNFAGGMPSYQPYQWSLYPNGTYQYIGSHTP
ncbi:RTX toxin [Neobacillus sp. PS3-34]|uniref:RTX toxin n=1 Tax=Neobacillus sp. PS3-34 TaxID=3070678 RepID=UPI0027E0093A|nr:RTX toxin [Neobacillus sp. PS3-34]WML46817.1 RTX toxin [Neobacillus sp. PS3-34]